MASCKIVRHEPLCWCEPALQKRSNNADLECRLPRITELILTFMKPVKLMQNHIARVPKLRRDKSRHVWWVHWLRQYAVWPSEDKPTCTDTVLTHSLSWKDDMWGWTDVRPALWWLVDHCLSRLLFTSGYPSVHARTACNRALHSPSCLISGNNCNTKYCCQLILSCIKQLSGDWLRSTESCGV